MPFLRHLQKKGIEFEFYDAIHSKWSSGRVNNYTEWNPKIVTFLNKNKIGFSIVFGNPIIDLDYKKSSKELEVLNFLNSSFGPNNKKINSVILTADNLLELINTNYNNLITTYSITGHPSDVLNISKRIEEYKLLSKKYDRIVPKFELVFNKTFLKEIDSSKLIPIINDTCIYNCPVFKEHCDAIAELNRKYNDPIKEFGYEESKKISHCWIPSFDPDIGSEKDQIKYGCQGLGMDILNEKDLLELFNTGYNKVKISGREFPEGFWKEEILRILKIVTSTWFKFQKENLL